MSDNPYARWLSVDNDLCLPVINQAGLDAVLQEVALRSITVLGEGPHPWTYLDLEHLQIADYGKFEGVNDEQQEFISRLHAQEPIRPEEMIFLGLRSLFQFAWPEPKSEDDIRFAAAYDRVLNEVLIETSLDRAKRFTAPEALLPYWGRLAFLRVMVELPADNIARFGLGRVACTLAKNAKFNATTFALESGPVISMNYALEPILKHINRYLLHYFGTREMAGPKRLSRAWEGIVPTVLHFWSNVVATRLTHSPTMLYEQEMAIMAHRLTADQLDFIVMHELGHVALDHPRRMKTEGASGHDVTSIRHEFEFAADAFALGLMRSKLIKKVRGRTETPKAADPENTPIGGVVASLRSYQSGLGAAYLLFAYMDFIQRAGELLRDRLGAQINIREQMDSHPRASARLEHLELINLGEYLYTSPLQRYAHGFLQNILDYAVALDDAALLASLKLD